MKKLGGYDDQMLQVDEITFKCTCGKVQTIGYRVGTVGIHYSCIECGKFYKRIHRIEPGQILHLETHELYRFCGCGCCPYCDIEQGRQI